MQTLGGVNASVPTFGSICRTFELKTFGDTGYYADATCMQAIS